jgi:hypothetical protein
MGRAKEGGRERGREREREGGREGVRARIRHPRSTRGGVRVSPGATNSAKPSVSETQDHRGF